MKHVLDQAERTFSLSTQFEERIRKPYRGVIVALCCAYLLGLTSACDRKPGSTEGRTAEVISVTKDKAEKGEAEAQFRLGLMFATEDGVPLSPVEAVDWYRKAAEQGHLQAQIHLAECYMNGTGVQSDPTKAARWYLSAAEKGDASSQNRMGAMSDLGLGVPQDASQAALWYRRAAEQGLAEAQSNLGVLYVSGRGVVRDLVEAYKWLTLAGQNGYHRDAGQLVEASSQLTPEQLAEAKRQVAKFRKKK